MHSLVYTSRLLHPFSDAEVPGMLDRWRRRNERGNITGVLLYNDGAVLQVLEGSRAAVQDLFAAIAADVRHCAVVRLGDGPVPGRAFADWSLRFHAVDAADFARCLQHWKTGSPRAQQLAPLLAGFLASEPW
ncbi:BLUF domain-containing protein [Hymenobacter arizonensis]|uniref:Sensors of blue-light using FAD n=1 Tax=Hymenobacter arizonensis TaxID=1227077 RepID=A0A1I6BDX9_HYMAR|nr:BLUF domain-containing protein [Hymenobacter arizonensis]SFQ79111.1 Sensors of blue-light using FAD [Hymenobacter arizonensis]